jgi:hypothetical protein
MNRLRFLVLNSLPHNPGIFHPQELWSLSRALSTPQTYPAQLPLLLIIIHLTRLHALRLALQRDLTKLELVLEIDSQLSFDLDRPHLVRRLP